MSEMKTRIKRIFTSLPFIIGIFVIVYAGFGMVYYKKQAESRELEARMAPTRIVLERPAPNLKELEEKLSEAKAEFDKEWASLPDSKQGIELYYALVDVAAQNNVEIVSMAASQLVGAEKGNTNLKILPYNISLEGSEASILAFISSLADSPGLLRSSEINNVNISNSTSESEDETTPIAANMQIHVYVRSD